MENELKHIINLGAEGKFDHPDFKAWMDKMDPMKQPEYSMRITFPTGDKDATKVG